MKNFSLIIISFLLVNPYIYSFPDVEKYPHDIVEVKGKLANVTKTKDWSKIHKTRFSGFDGYSGYCPITKYHVYINGHDELATCTIFLTGKEPEISHSTMEIELTGGFLAKYFYFKEGEVIFVSGNDHSIFGWRSWVKNQPTEE